MPCSEMSWDNREWLSGGTEYDYIDDSKALLGEGGWNLIYYCFSRVTEVLS